MLCLPYRCIHHGTSTPFLLPCSQVAGRTNDSAGDGTTTASVLAREMIHFGLQNVTAGANPIAVKKGIDKTCEFLVGKLKEHAKPVKGRLDIKVRSRTTATWA
jgi:chaperonin GroEL (HSP60 family)